MKKLTKQIVENTDFQNIEIPESFFKFEKMKVF